VKILLLYHYFHPDDVVSARLFSELGAGLRRAGWEVEARPCNRGCRDERRAYPARETWEGVDIRRVWRPPLRQASVLGRLLNAVWMLKAWGRLARRPAEAAPDVVLLGTDPALSVLAAPALKRRSPGTRIALWCHDLYPDAFRAAGVPLPSLLATRMARAYRACDLVVDLGPCMRRRLDVLGAPAPGATVTPWALREDPATGEADAAVRRDLFGAGRLALLYSGTYGRAHSADGILALARAMREDGATFCFAVRGNSADELTREIRAADSNVRLAGFAPEDALDARLASADVHVVTLRPEWTGIVVPSKFFGALAAGRPVLFAGSRESSVARWIDELGVGWVLDRGGWRASGPNWARMPPALPPGRRCRSGAGRPMRPALGVPQPFAAGTGF
jgi:hypothetical protein